MTSPFQSSVDGEGGGEEEEEEGVPTKERIRLEGRWTGVKPAKCHQGKRRLEAGESGARLTGAPTIGQRWGGGGGAGDGGQVERFKGHRLEDVAGNAKVVAFLRKGDTLVVSKG